MIKEREDVILDVRIKLARLLTDISANLAQIYQGSTTGTRLYFQRKIFMYMSQLISLDEHDVQRVRPITDNISSLIDELLEATHNRVVIAQYINEINTIYEDYKKDLAAVFDMDSTDNRKVCRSVRQKVISTIRVCFDAMEDLNHSASVRTKDALFDIIDAMIASDDDDINAAFYATQDLHTALDALVENTGKTSVLPFMEDNQMIADILFAKYDIGGEKPNV